MLVRFSSGSLKDGRRYEYVIRFVLGGAATVLTGLIAKAFGPAIGGLFLALPAIFCASVTLIEAHEKRRKRKAGLAGERRGREAAALDSSGAALGGLGMLAFAAAFYGLVLHSVVLAFTTATAIWLAVSVMAWWMWRKLRVSAVAGKRTDSPEANVRGASPREEAGSLVRDRRPPLVSSPRR